MADMATILSRQGQRGGIDERTLLIMTLLQGLGEVGKTASGIADWAMRSEDRAYKKKRRPIDEEMQDLEMDRLRQYIKQADARFKQEQKDRKANEDAQKLERDLRVKKLNAEIAEIGSKRKTPASPGERLTAIIKTVQANVDGIIAESTHKGAPMDVPTALKQAYPQFVLAATEESERIRKETENLPPEERIKERIRRGREVFGAIPSASGVMFPAIVGSVVEYGNLADMMKKEGIQDIDSPEGKQALDELWDRNSISAGILSSLMDKDEKIDRKTYREAAVQTLISAESSKSLQNDLSKMMGDDPVGMFRELILMGHEGGALLGQQNESGRITAALQSLEPSYQPFVGPETPERATFRQDQERQMLDSWIKAKLGPKALAKISKQPSDVIHAIGAPAAGGILEPMRRRLAGQPPLDPTAPQNVFEALQKAGVIDPSPWQPPPKWAEGLQPWQ